MKHLVSLLLLLLLVPSGPAAQRVALDLGLLSREGVVVSSSSYASDVGAGILARGGNAVDAAIAVAFALAVTHPSAGNIGGGGFMVVRTPAGEATTFDYREIAPGGATETMYLDEAGDIDRSLTAAGYLAPGVPGTVRGMALAHERFGTLPWEDLVTPAVALARDGFALPERLARALNAEVRGRMSAFPASVAAYGKPGGGEWTTGDTIVLPDLAASLEAIATGGPDAFYTGWIADRIADDMARHGGLINRADLAGYQAKERAPVRGRFRDYEIISMPPPSSGGVALIEMLNILEAAGIHRMPRGSPQAIHHIAEAMRRAYLDRARHLGDPDFVDVPVARLIARPHARQLARSIDPARASSSVELGRDIVSEQGDEPEETTHFSVVDRNGLAVANTYTLEGGFGSHLVIEGTGILLNNEMGDFNKKPGTTNLTGDIGTDANLIAPGKRMLSSMTPTIVARDGKLALVTGSPGGRTIINTVLSIVLHVAAWDLEGRRAVDAPRMHHQWLPDRLTIEGNGVSDETLAALEAMGHTVRVQGTQGSAQTIWMHPQTGAAFGVVDRRDSTAKASAPSAPSAPKPGLILSRQN
jgi:gamma-glutamyltranspeptidase/glutathione hydrolase